MTTAQSTAGDVKVGMPDGRVTRRRCRINQMVTVVYP